MENNFIIKEISLKKAYFHTEMGKLSLARQATSTKYTQKQKAENKKHYEGRKNHGKITFEISYSQGVLPEIFPDPRAKMT